MPALRANAQALGGEPKQLRRVESVVVGYQKISANR